MTPRPICHRPSTLARAACKHGHAWIPKNITTNARGVMQCRLCISATARRHYANYAPISPAQLRVLSRFKESRQLPVNSEIWTRHDTLPLRKLIKRGRIEVISGPSGEYYLLKYQQKAAA